MSRQLTDYSSLPSAEFTFAEMGEIQAMLQTMAEAFAMDGQEPSTAMTVKLAESLGISLDSIAIEAAEAQFLESETEPAEEAQGGFQQAS